MGDAVEHTIGLVVHPHNPVRDSVDVITEVARERGATVIAVEADSGRAGTGVEPVSTDAFVQRADLVISPAATAPCSAPCACSPGGVRRCSA